MLSLKTNRQCISNSSLCLSSSQFLSPQCRNPSARWLWAKRQQTCMWNRKMSEDHSFTETSSKSSVAGEIATDSSINGTVASPVCDTDEVNPPQTGHRPTARGFIMMPPEEKLKHFNRRAQDLESSQQIDACIQDLVRCAALTRLVHGDGLELAKAHARLADVYFHRKGWPAQAQEHAALARELLPFCSPTSTSREDRLQMLTCLLCILLTQGGAALLTADVEEAESSYLKAERIVEELHRQGGITQEEKVKNELEIATFLSRVYQRQARPEEALDQCERSLLLLEGRGGKPKEICSVYKEMAAIEQGRGHLDQAIEHLSKAHAIAVSQSQGGPDGAHISHSLALVLSGAAESRHNEAAAHYFEESLNAYRSCVGPDDVAFLTAQDDYCHFLLLNGQQERCVEMQRSSLAPKRSAFGDLSGEVADTLQLIGGVEMTQGRIREAHKTLRKCLEIQNIMYGPQHKKTKATQKTVDMLTRAPGVAGRRQKQGSGKTRPTSCAALPADGKEGKVPSLTL